MPTDHLTTELLSEIDLATERVRACLDTSPLVPSPWLRRLTGANVFLKCENLQRTGSFKIRGASNKLLSLKLETPLTTVVAASTGNHGRAVATAAADQGCQAVVFVPNDCQPTKVNGIRDCGGQIRIAGSDCVESELAARQFAAEQRFPYLSPYNDLQVIAGQGTVGAELCDQLDRIDAVFVSMGGGGLVSGAAAHIKSRFPKCHVVACSPVNSKVMMESMRAGRILELPSCPTLSDGTAGGVEPGSITLPLCQQLVDECREVTEPQIGVRLLEMIDQHAMLIEGAAAVAVAALADCGERFAGQNVVVVLCGANMGSAKLAEVFKQHGQVT